MYVIKLSKGQLAQHMQVTEANNKAVPNLKRLVITADIEHQVPAMEMEFTNGQSILCEDNAPGFISIDIDRPNGYHIFTQGGVLHVHYNGEVLSRIQQFRYEQDFDELIPNMTLEIACT
jgi:hypothetical protein